MCEGVQRKKEIVREKKLQQWMPQLPGKEISKESAVSWMRGGQLCSAPQHYNAGASALIIAMPVADVDLLMQADESVCNYFSCLNYQLKRIRLFILDMCPLAPLMLLDSFVFFSPRKSEWVSVLCSL